MRLTLEDVFDKIFKGFFDVNKWIAVKVNNDVRIYKKEGWKPSCLKRLIIMFPMSYIEPAGIYDFEEQFKNTQKLNPTVQGKIKGENHGDKRFFLEMLDTIRIDYKNQKTCILEKHLIELIENSIKLAKYEFKDKHTKEKISYDKIKDIDCEKEEIVHYSKLIQELLLKHYSEVFEDSNMYFKDKVTSDNVYQCLSYILYKCLLDVSFKNDAVKNALEGSLEKFENTIFSQNEIPIASSLVNANRRIEFYTCAEFKKIANINYTDIAEQLLENDKKLFGDIGEHSGTISQWAEHMFLSPEQWGLLCLDKKQIIGNYSCVYLNSDQERKLQNGNLIGNLISAESVQDSGNLKRNGEAALYLMNLSVNEEFATFENWNILFSQFGKYIRSEIRKGIVIKNLYATSFKKEYDSRFKRYGFSHLIKRCGKGNFFKIDMYQDTSKCNWLSFNEHFDKENFIFRSMNHEDLHNSTLLRDIATLIHLNDEFIYEQGMMSLEHAQKILPSLFSQEDTMFNSNNIFLAISKINKRVAGVILAKEGKLHWNTKKMKNTAKFYGIKLKNSLDKVKTEYFSRYDNENVSANTLSLINSNVHPNLKLLYATSLEEAMLQDFIAKNKTKDMLLYVLQQAEREFDVYSRNGFELLDNIPGFNINNDELPSSLLYRKRQT